MDCRPRRVRLGALQRDVTWVGMEDSLNLGVGMVAVVSASAASGVLAAINEAGVAAMVWVP